MQRNVAFVQIRNELPPHACRSEGGQRGQCEGSQKRRHAGAQRRRQYRLIGRTDGLHDAVLAMRNAPANEDRNGGRHKGQRQNQCSEQCHHHGERHGMKHLAFDPRQREHRQVHDQDHDHAEDTWPQHFARGLANHAESFRQRQQPLLALLGDAEMTQAVLDDDHGAVDDQAEVQRTKAHEVAGNPRADHARDGCQHGDGNDGGGDDRGADVAQQCEQDRDHQQGAFGEILRDRADRRVDERGAIVDGLRTHAGGQGRRDRCQLRGSRGRHRAAVLADQHEHRAEYHLLSILGSGARAQFVTHTHVRDLRQADANALAMGQHDLAQLFHARDLARRADQVLRSIALDIAGADVLVVPCHGGHDVAEREIVGHEPLRIGCDHVGLLVAADRVDLDDARRVAQLRADDPVLCRAQIDRRISAARIGRHRVHENFAETRRDRSECRLDALRQAGADFVETFAHELSREIDVGAIPEHGSHLRQTVARQRSRVLQRRQPGQRRFHCKGHTLLGFQRRVTRRLRIDLHLDVRDVGYGIDGQALEIDQAEQCDDDDGRQHDPALPQREIDNAGQHGRFSDHGSLPISRCRP